MCASQRTLDQLAESLLTAHIVHPPDTRTSQTSWAHWLLELARSVQPGGAHTIPDILYMVLPSCQALVSHFTEH